MKIKCYSQIPNLPLIYQNDIPKFYKTLPVNLVLEFCVCQSINILDQRHGVIKKIFLKIFQTEGRQKRIFFTIQYIYTLRHELQLKQLFL